eukprot:scaffold91848_cov27-Tisochrysis_lutea.AAC.2
MTLHITHWWLRSLEAQLVDLVADGANENVTPSVAVDGVRRGARAQAGLAFSVELGVRYDRRASEHRRVGARIDPHFQVDAAQGLRRRSASPLARFPRLDHSVVAR